MKPSKNITDRAIEKAQKAMSPSRLTEIEYLAPDGSRWRATLSEVRAGLVPGSISNPDFLLYRDTAEAVARTNALIQYQAPDGSFWSSQCLARADLQGSEITFEFEHWRSGKEHGRADHRSEGIFFLDWERKPWFAKVRAMVSPGVPEFMLRRAS